MSDSKVVVVDSGVVRAHILELLNATEVLVVDKIVEHSILPPSELECPPDLVPEPAIKTELPKWRKPGKRRMGRPK